MTNETKKIAELASLLKEHDLSEIEVREGEKSIKVCRNQITTVAATAPSISEQPKENKKEIHGNITKSPMVGTVYLSPAPGAKPFVSPGDRIKVGDVLCLIEAMKMFNKIKADKSGIVSKILVNNEHPVEFGSELFVITED